MPLKTWKTIADSKIRHIWANSDGTGETAISPDYYQDNGTPTNDDGDDMIYVRTEIME